MILYVEYECCEGYIVTTSDKPFKAYSTNVVLKWDTEKFGFPTAFEIDEFQEFIIRNPGYLYDGSFESDEIESFDDSRIWELSQLTFNVSRYSELTKFESSINWEALSSDSEQYEDFDVYELPDGTYTFSFVYKVKIEEGKVIKESMLFQEFLVLVRDHYRYECINNS